MTFPAAVKQAMQVYTDGDAAVKVGVTGFSLIATAISETVAGIVFAALAVLWLVDMLSGALRAIAEGGLGNFRFGRFMEGFSKLFAAGLGIVIATVLDVMAIDAGLDRPYITTAAMTGIAFGFGASATENLAYWFPGVAGQLSRILNRGQAENDDRWMKHLPEEKQARVRAALSGDDVP